MDLYAFLNRMMAQPFVWGECDCVTMPADWVSLITGKDPAADLRMTYSSAGECQRVTRFFTDPLGVVAPRMQACGLAETIDPQRGDVGVVMLHGMSRAHGAICLDGNIWGLKGPGGMAAQMPSEVLRAWKVA